MIPHSLYLQVASWVINLTSRKKLLCAWKTSVSSSYWDPPDIHNSFSVLYDDHICQNVCSSPLASAYRAQIWRASQAW